MHHPTDRITHSYTSRGALAGTRNSSMGATQSGSSCILKYHNAILICYIFNRYLVRIRPYPVLDQLEREKVGW